MKHYYTVSIIEKEKQVKTPLGKRTLSLVWTDGKIGVMPVFTNKKKAKKYSGNHEIISFEGVK